MDHVVAQTKTNRRRTLGELGAPKALQATGMGALVMGTGQVVGHQSPVGTAPDLVRQLWPKPRGLGPDEASPLPHLVRLLGPVATKLE